MGPRKFQNGMDPLKKQLCKSSGLLCKAQKKIGSTESINLVPLFLPKEMSDCSNFLNGDVMLKQLSKLK